jgi:hypothetical protein
LDQRPGRNRERDNLRNQIRARVLSRWPEISNPYHPAAVAAMTKEADAIVKLIESQSGFKRWDDLVRQAEDQGDKSLDLERRWVKCQRFLYVAETVALEANLEKFAGRLVQARYKALREAEGGRLGKAPAAAAVGAGR